MSVPKTAPQQPGALWHAASAAVMATTGAICRTFLYGLNSVEVVGLDNFLRLLDARKDVETRQRGLITVCNHVSVLDDPLIWGVLPWRYAMDHRNLRWGLGAHDICYKNSLLGHFFFAGQTLPTHRLHHSPLGGLFQPTLDQAIRILTRPGEAPVSASLKSLASSSSSSSLSTLSSLSAALSSPSPPSSSSSSPFFSTTGVDRWPVPAAIPGNRLGWVHIFPEGGVHQQHERGLRYFRWGVARLILESEPAPDVVPMFIDGPDRVMPEDREFPRFLPRIGQQIRVVFGDALGPDAFAAERARWREIVAAGHSDADHDGDAESGKLGAASTEAAALRRQVAQRVRDEVLKLRRQRGYPDEDPKLGLAETWAREPALKRYRSTVDGSMVNQE